MADLQCIEKKFNFAVIKTCKDAGCKLNLSGLQDFIVLKGEKIYKDQPVCDCIIFVKHQRLIAGVVELKSKTVDVSKVREQLTGGLRIVSDALQRCGIDASSVKCYVVVFAKKWRKSEFKVITSSRIKFRGKNLPILPKRCGDSFVAII